jgi:hypothetical protein
MEWIGNVYNAHFLVINVWMSQQIVLLVLKDFFNLIMIVIFISVKISVLLVNILMFH